MIFYLLNKGQQTVKLLNNDETIESNLDEAINTASELKFSLPLQKRLDSNIYYILIPEYHGNDFLMFKIISEDVQKDRVEYSAVESAYDELKSYEYIKDIRPHQMNAAQMLQQVLKNTRWSLGYVEDTGIQSTTFYYITILEAIQKIVDLFKVELTFTIQLDPVTQKITGRRINLYQQQGRRTGKRFEYGSNLLTVTREEDSQNLVTALVGRGKGIQVSGQDTEDASDDNYGRRLTFADVEWKTSAGAPVNKPKGQEYVEDPKATALYGFSDGHPRIGLVTFDDIEDPNQLINATWSALLEAKRPKVSFKAEVTDVGNLQLGDTIAIIRHDLGIEYFTRVYKVHHNLKDENRNTVEMGDDFSSRSITSAISTAIQTSQDATTVANTAAIAANGKNRNFYSNTKPLFANEGDNLFLNLGNGETEMWVWHHGQWEFVQSTVELHTVQKEVKEAQNGLDDAKKQIADNLAKADGDIAELNASIRDQKKAFDTDIDELNASIRDQKGTIDGLSTTVNTVVIPKVTDVTNEVSDTITKVNEQKNIVTELQNQANQQGKDISKITTDVHGVTADLANLNGDVNQTKATVQGLQSTLGNAQGDIAQIKVDAKKLETSLAGKVDNSTYATFVNQTNQALNAKLVASDLNGYAKTTDVQATAEGLRVDISSVTDRMNNLKIGSVNQLRNTDPDSLSNTFPDRAWRVDSGGDGHGTLIDLESKFSAKHGFRIFGNTIGNKDFNQRTMYWNGGEYVFTVYIRLAPETEQASATALIRSWNYTKDVASYLKTITITSKEWHKFSIEIDSSSFYKDDCSFLFGITGVGSLDFAEPMLVTGNVASDWSPNPDDLTTQVAFSELVQTVSGLQSTVSGNYGGLQSQISQTAQAIHGELSNQITGVQNQITATANGLNARIDNIRIGGRNLLRGTSDQWRTLTGSNWLYGTTATDMWTSTAYYHDGDQFTYSATITNTSEVPVRLALYCYDKDKKTVLKKAVGPTVGPSSGSIPTYVSITIDGKTWFLCSDIETLDGEASTFSIQVKDEQLEEGNVRTAWTTNPDDIASQFTEVNATINGLKSTVSGNYGTLNSQISQTAKTIRQEVSDKTNGLQTQINQQANNFNVSLNSLRNETAWQKVTSAIDANNYKTTGNYWIQAVPNSNTPDSSAWAYLQVVAYPDAKRIKQTWQRDNNENEIYTRLLIGDNWTSWQRTVTGGNIMAQINMSAGTTLIQNNKIYMDASSTVFSGKAFIPDAAITNISADKINAGTLDAGRINVINLNANNITTGTINGANLKINLNSGEILFQKGRIASTNGLLNIDLNFGTMSVTGWGGAGVYFQNGKMILDDGTTPNLDLDLSPKYGMISRSGDPLNNGLFGMQLESPNGVIMKTKNYNGNLFRGWVDKEFNGAFLGVSAKGDTDIISGRHTNISGGLPYGDSYPQQPTIVIGTDDGRDTNGSGKKGSRIVLAASYVHFPDAYKTTTGSAPNMFIAWDGAIVRSTSASKYKTDIKRSHSTEYGEKLLDLPTATWTDKGQKERYEAGKRHIKPEKYFGMIAEDLADAGLDLLVSRNPQTHEIEGIQYERIAPALLPVLKELKDKVNRLEKQINE